MTQPNEALWRRAAWPNLDGLTRGTDSADRALRESEERLQLAVYAANLGIFEHDHGIDAQYWSPAMREILGWRAAEPGSMSDFFELIHPEDRIRTIDAIRRAHDPTGDGLYSFEHRIARRDGGIRWVRVCARTSFEGEGENRRPVRTIGTLADSTELKQADEVGGRLAAIVESAEDAILSKTLDGTITSWNTGAQRLFGYPAAEILGKTYALIVPAELLEEEPLIQSRILRGESIEHHETVRIHKSGRRVRVIVSISPVRASTGEVIGSAKIMHDVSARKHLEREVLEIAVREQRRIGYELHDGTGQELTALCLLAETLVKKLDGEKAAEKAIADKLLAGLKRSLAQIRSVARGLIPVDIDSRGLLAALGELAARIQQASGAICTMDFGKSPVEWIDNQCATQMFHIAQEAVTNALRHGKPSRIALSLLEENHGVTLRIQDDGAGLPADVAESQGMGLKIMHYRAGLINGRLTVESASPVGTVVTCRLSQGANHEPEDEIVRPARQDPDRR
jgi:PAS domain S-box-containing protein